MCRIAGVVSASNHDYRDSVSRMLGVLAHGGPDDEGVYAQNSVVFGHRRLAIIDLSNGGHQPMTSNDSQLCISFNGEVYNYLSLKEELEGLGVVFNTKTDTEVILQAYKKWSIKAFNRFQGIFAFSLFDKDLNKIYLVRDQVGVKPLYYSLDNERLVFASEVKAFKAFDNSWAEYENWKILFLTFGSLPYPTTTLAGVLQLAPGNYLQLDLTTFHHELVEYYKFIPSNNYEIRDYPYALDAMRSSIEEAIQKNLISDASIGIFLSGGVDSSILTLLADKFRENVTTISVNFEDAIFDERDYQEKVLSKVKNIKHKFYTITEEMFWDKIDDVWNAMDQPSIDGVNSYFVSACAKTENLKVVLSGLGADEIFGGYKSINRIHWLKLLRMIPLKRVAGKVIGALDKTLKRLVFLTVPGAVGDYLFLRGIHTPDTVAEFLGIPEEKVWDTIRKIKIDIPSDIHINEYVSFLESKIYLTNQLLKDTDYMGMWHGVEIRTPYLDVELIKKMNSIHPSLHYKKGWSKFLLSASFLDILPQEVIFRKKFGFTFPFSLWIRNNPERFKKMLPNKPAVNEIFKDFEKGKRHWSKCWSFAVVKQFRN